MDDHKPTIPKTLRWLLVLLGIGPVLLYVAATAYGMLEVHGSTDTWIGLAGGRNILEKTDWTNLKETFPKRDTFSYTFYGTPWYNQNWLTHVVQYLLYSHVSPNAVIYFTWMLSASVFALVLLAAYWRSGTWLGAVLAASIVGLGCRDFLSARPATTGFVCIASLWAILCALEGQRDKTRRWPIALLLPLLLIWGGAHGSFVFGYGVLGLYVGHWFVVRTIRVRHCWSFSLLLPLILMVVGGTYYSVVPPDTRMNPNDILVIGSTSYEQAKLEAVVGVTLAYVVYWICIRRFKPSLAIRDGQIVAIALVVVVALLLTLILGPFGVENFTHGQKVAGSKVFRNVSEWLPPYAPGRHFPPVWRFWTILGCSLGTLAACGLLALVAPRSTDDKTAQRRLHTSLFDAAVVIIGLAMTIWARRFAPLYLIFGAPVFLTWIVLALRPLNLSLQRYLGLGLVAGAWLLAVATVVETTRKAYDELVVNFRDQPQFNLLERVTRYDMTPHTGIMFLTKNHLKVNVLVGWTQAGPVMHYARNARVFMDGRAQQVYDEEHYKKYYLLLVAPDTPRQIMMRILNEHQTDAVLLRRWGPARNLGIALEQSPDWIPVLLDERYGLFLRKESRALAQLGELLRRGQEWRPDRPPAIASRGFVWAALTPPDRERALQSWLGAVRRDMRLGKQCFRPMTRALLSLGRAAEARQLVKTYYQLLNQPLTGLDDQLRRQLLRILNDCWRDIETLAPSTRPAEDEG